MTDEDKLKARILLLERKLREAEEYIRQGKEEDIKYADSIRKILTPPSGG